MTTKHELLLNQSELGVIKRFYPEGFTAIDLETTGLSPFTDNIIEIAAIKINQIGQLSLYHTLIKPHEKISDSSIAIHGITDEMVANEPAIQEIMPDFLEFLGDTCVAAHNARFDAGFIAQAIYEQNLDFPSCLVLDTHILSKRSFPKLGSYSLKKLCEKLKIPLATHHRATEDAYACLKLVISCLTQISPEQKALSILRESCLFKFNDFQNPTNFRLPGHLKILKSIMLANETADIQYSGGHHRNRWRPIRPIGMIPFPEGLLLHAYCLIDYTYKTFQLDKISDAREYQEKG